MLDSIYEPVLIQWPMQWIASQGQSLPMTYVPFFAVDWQLEEATGTPPLRDLTQWSPVADPVLYTSEYDEGKISGERHTDDATAVGADLMGIFLLEHHL